MALVLSDEQPSGKRTHASPSVFAIPANNETAPTAQGPGNVQEQDRFTPPLQRFFAGSAIARARKGKGKAVLRPKPSHKPLAYPSKRKRAKDDDVREENIYESEDASGKRARMV